MPASTRQFSEIFPENYIVRLRSTPKTPVDLGRSVLPDHLHIIPTVFSPNLDPFGSGPPIISLLSAKANCTETVSFSEFEDPAAQAHTSDHQTHHPTLATDTHRRITPAARPIPEPQTAKYVLPSPHFRYQNSTFQPTWRCNVQGSNQDSRLRSEDERNDYIRKLKGRTRPLHATVQPPDPLDHYQARLPAAYHAQEGTDTRPPPRQPSRHSQLRGPEVEEGQSATRPVQKACDYKVQHHHGLPAATLLGCHSGPEEGCRKVPYGTFQGMQGLSGSPTISQGKAVKQ